MCGRRRGRVGEAVTDGGTSVPSSAPISGCLRVLHKRGNGGVPQNHQEEKETEEEVKVEGG